MLVSVLICAALSGQVAAGTQTTESPAGRALIKKMQAAVRAASPVTGTLSSHVPEMGDSDDVFKTLWPGRLSVVSYLVAKGRRKALVKCIGQAKSSSSTSLPQIPTLAAPANKTQ
jgi:hypothetical protein